MRKSEEIFYFSEILNDIIGQLDIKCIWQPSCFLNNKDNFYLGAWCLADMTNDNFSKLLIHEYHWNNRKKLVEDYNGLRNFISYNLVLLRRVEDMCLSSEDL